MFLENSNDVCTQKPYLHMAHLPAEIRWKVFSYLQHPVLDLIGGFVHLFEHEHQGMYCLVCGEHVIREQCCWISEFGDSVCVRCMRTRDVPDRDDLVHHPTLGCTVYGCKCERNSMP